MSKEGTKELHNVGIRYDTKWWLLQYNAQYFAFKYAIELGSHSKFIRCHAILLCNHVVTKIQKYLIVHTVMQFDVTSIIILVKRSTCIIPKCAGTFPSYSSCLSTTLVTAVVN